MFYKLLTLYLYGYALSASAITRVSEPILPFTNAAVNPLCYAYNNPAIAHQNICLNAPSYFLGTGNKNDYQVIVDLNHVGTAKLMGKQLETEDRIERNRLTLISRNTIEETSIANAKRIWDQLHAILLKYPDQSRRFGQNLQKIVDPIFLRLQEKYKTFITAHHSQQNKSYANCGEYSRVTAAIYYKLALLGQDIGTIQIFSLQASKSSHAYVVLDSGIQAEKIVNDPSRVEKILLEVNKKAYLCDEYNQMEGLYHTILDLNKFYGKNSAGKWSSLEITNLNQDIDLSKVPEKAYEFRKDIRAMYAELDALFLNNIQVPESTIKSRKNTC